MHGHDAGVIELAGDLRFFEEAPERARVDGWRVAARGRVLLAEHDLHRQRAAQVLVPHSQHGAHAAAPDLAEQAIAEVRRGVSFEALQQVA